MHFISLFLILTAISASESSQCLPKKWQGIELVSVPVSGSVAKIYMNVSFDADRKMVAADLFGVQAGEKIHEFSLQDFSTGIEYDVVKGKCVTNKMTSGFPWCLPDTAAVLLKSYIGPAGSKIATTTYVVQENPATGSGVFTVTDAEHIPINFQLSAIMQGAPVEVYGVTLGIKDPSVFQIPAICKQPRFEESEFEIEIDL